MYTLCSYYQNQHGDIFITQKISHACDSPPPSSPKQLLTLICFLYILILSFLEFFPNRKHCCAWLGYAEYLASFDLFLPLNNYRVQPKSVEAKPLHHHNFSKGTHLPPPAPSKSTQASVPEVTDATVLITLT